MLWRIEIILIALITIGLSDVRAQTGLSHDEIQLLNLLNQERDLAGLPKFSPSQQLMEAAQNHTKQLVEHGQLSHQFAGEAGLVDRVGVTGLRSDASGENVAFASNVEEAHQDLMNSPPHRANILNPQYNLVGLSLMWRGRSLYVTEDFAHGIPSYTEEQFRDAFVAAFNKARVARGRGTIAVQPDSRLREAACSGTSNLRDLIRGMNGASEWVIFTSAQPEALGADVLRAAGDSTFRRMNVGVCFQPRKEHGFDSFRLIAVFFLIR